MENIFSLSIRQLSILLITTFLIVSCGSSDEQVNDVELVNDTIIENTNQSKNVQFDSTSNMHEGVNGFNNFTLFDLDTFSTLSEGSLALYDEAKSLQKKLMTILPKFSLTIGLGENKITRNYFLIEGDIKVDKEELYYYCLKRLQKPDTSIHTKIKSRKLTIATDRSGNLAIWPKGLTIKYCVMRNTFSSKSYYEAAIKSMREATNDWMNTCNIKFQYVPNLDNTEIDLESNQDQILFIVRQLNVNGEFIAQAFFPSDPPYNRMLLLDNSFFTSDFNKTGVLRHELGHILGFRHEHIWSLDVACRGENVIQDQLGAKPLTNYDPFSVMHYPCGLNQNNRDLGLTDFDKAGAVKIYPFN